MNQTVHESKKSPSHKVDDQWVECHLCSASVKRDLQQIRGAMPIQSWCTQTRIPNTPSILTFAMHRNLQHSSEQYTTLSLFNYILLYICILSLESHSFINIDLS